VGGAGGIVDFSDGPESFLVHLLQGGLALAVDYLECGFDGFQCFDDRIAALVGHVAERG